MQIEPNKIKNILAVRNDRFGEFLLNIPAFRALKETYNNAKLIVVTSPYVAELAEGIPFIDEIIAWGKSRHCERPTGAKQSQSRDCFVAGAPRNDRLLPKGELLHSFFSRLGLIKLLRSKHIDIAVMLNPAKEFNILTYLAGIPIRVGYDRKWGFLLTHKMKDKKYLGEKHEVEYNLELVNLIGARTQDKGISLNIDAGTHYFKSNILPGTHYFKSNVSPEPIALHPWTSDPIKQWPKERFMELARRLGSEAGIKVIIIGGREEAERESDLFAGLGDNIINLAGKTTLPELAAILKRCRLLVSCDSGPAHLACSVGTPVIVLFRNDIPGKCAKRWGPWGKGGAVIEKDSLSDITVEEVFEKIRQRIGEISYH